LLLREVEIDGGEIRRAREETLRAWIDAKECLGRLFVSLRIERRWNSCKERLW